MVKRKKNNIAFMISIVLFTLFLFSSIVTSGILAKYTGVSSNDDDARVAKFYVDETNSEEVLTLTLSNSSSVNFTVEVVNFKDSTVCETAFNYGFTVRTLDNLPLKITISDPAKTGAGTLASISGITCTNGEMLPNGKDTHTYVITVSWDTTVDGWNDYENSKKVDLVIIDFIATQID